MPQWTIRPYRAGDEKAILELFATVFGHDRSLAHWRWKFAHNPYNPGNPPTPLITLAESADGRIVGQYALLPVPLRIDGQPYLGAQSLDTMTHPDFQGQGMFTALAREAFVQAQALGVAVLYGFPNPNSYPGFVRRLGWQDLGPMRTWVRPLNLGRRLGLPGRVAQALWDAVTLPPMFSTAMTVRSGPAAALLTTDPDLVAGFDELCRVAQADQPVALARSLAYWRWRYGACPDTAYHLIIMLDDHQTLHGVLVYRRDGARWRLVDGVSRPAAPGPAGLLAAWIRAARASDPAPEAVTVWSGRIPPYVEALRRTGFRPLRAGTPLIVRMLDDAVGSLPYRFEAWRLSAGDSDLY